MNSNDGLFDAFAASPQQNGQAPLWRILCTPLLQAAGTQHHTTAPPPPLLRAARSSDPPESVCRRAFRVAFIISPPRSYDSCSFDSKLRPLTEATCPYAAPGASPPPSACPRRGPLHPSAAAPARPLPSSASPCRPLRRSPPLSPLESSARRRQGRQTPYGRPQGENQGNHRRRCSSPAANQAKRRTWLLSRMCGTRHAYERCDAGSQRQFTSIQRQFTSMTHRTVCSSHLLSRRLQPLYPPGQRRRRRRCWGRHFHRRLHRNLSWRQARWCCGRRWSWGLPCGRGFSAFRFLLWRRLLRSMQAGSAGLYSQSAQGKLNQFIIRGSHLILMLSENNT